MLNCGTRVRRRSDENLMTARNLGVVFGRELALCFISHLLTLFRSLATLMRPADQSKEFGDMAGKALSIEWFVDNAPEIFQDPPQ